MKIGMVSPYGWDLPGGVQAHIQDLALYCMAQGHEVSVIAPAVDESALPKWVVSSGRPIAIPYNGAVARVAFGPVANRRVRKWINEGQFDLLHLHEPAIPSLSLLACWAAEGPLVGTFHVSAPKQKAIYAVGPILEPAIEKLHARIAVSETARTTLTDHLETDAVVIPNGINHGDFAVGSLADDVSDRTIGFIGRFDEPRKGLAILLESCEELLKRGEEFRVLIAGPGDPDQFRETMSDELRERTEFLGRVSDKRKQEILRSIALYVAPNTGGESFGIILAEAMAAGAPVVASDLMAFRDVLENGKAGEIFHAGDSSELALQIGRLLNDPERRAQLKLIGQESSFRFDWSNVGESILDIYRMVSASGEKVRLGNDLRSNKEKADRE
ncbi:MAG: glycosyltransferase family 4 protein [Candidatus Nanopelagicaceae bacterium]|jgi:phosphatidylinositol alpha-mannosyltransferase